MTWSSSERASRIPPSAFRAIKRRASAGAAEPSCSSTEPNRDTMSALPIRRKSNRWHRDRIGAADCWIFWGSVVAKMKITRGGGSSKIFSKAFHASRVSMCASSTMYTLWRPSPEGAYIARSRRSRASSTPRLDAASISTTSNAVWPPQIRAQSSQVPHGSPSWVRSGQFSAMARTRARVVLPTPRGPQKR